MNAIIVTVFIAAGYMLMHKLYDVADRLYQQRRKRLYCKPCSRSDAMNPAMTKEVFMYADHFRLAAA